jgi:hypothetical protein
MNPEEIRLRLIEAAARAQHIHKDGYAAGVLETAQLWEGYVIPKISGVPAGQGTLKLPKKAV